jgi:hypothetical protein
MVLGVRVLWRHGRRGIRETQFEIHENVGRRIPTAEAVTLQGDSRRLKAIRADSGVSDTEPVAVGGYERRKVTGGRPVLRVSASDGAGNEAVFVCGTPENPIAGETNR